MTTAPGLSNVGSERGDDSAEDDLVDSVRRELTAASAASPSETDPSVIVRRALDMLDAVTQLLRALSPPEIEATARRVYLGRLDGQHETLWRVYGRRHEVLADVFASQHSMFARLARRFLDGQDPSDDSRPSGKRYPQEEQP